MPDLQVYAPADGNVVPLTQVPDPAFSEAMLGDGIAIVPSSGFIAAPFDGTVVSVHKALHAVVVEQNGIEALIHIGVETVALQGQGFTCLVQKGDQVKKGQKLIEFDPVFIAAHAPSNLIILVITSPDGAKLNKAVPGPVKVGADIVFSLPDAASEQTENENNQSWFYSAPISIINPNGLHARPAGRLAQAAKAFSFPIELEFNNQVADAKSLVAIIGLSLSKGSIVRVRASAEETQAQKALTQLKALIESGLGEDPNECSCPAQDTCTCPENNISDFSASCTLKALTACGGVAQGPAYFFTNTDIIFAQTAQDPAQEKNNFLQALQETELDLHAEIKNSANKAAKEILQAHLELLNDPFVKEQTLAQVQLGKSAAAAFNEAVRASIDVLKKTKNRFLAERIADFKDLRLRVLHKLTGGQTTAPVYPQNCIVIAEDLLPSDVTALPNHVRGVILAEGSPTAHASILLRNMGLPAVVSAGECVLNIEDGTPLALQAEEGLIFIRPTAEQTEKLSTLCHQQEAARAQNQKEAQNPAITQDGTTIHICGNASNEREAVSAQENGADGLGLVRTEFLFFQNKELPSEEKQHSLYQHIVGALSGKSVILRTLDVGGDKPVPYLPLPAEENPILGLRGVRNYEAYRDVFLMQIRAMLRVQPLNAVRIMLPMVAFTDDFLEYKKLIEQEKEKLGISAPVQIGMMIEVPSAALLAEQFAEHADFFSIGTNDLTQYTLAIDRGHKTLCAQADPLHPAVLTLIAHTCKGAAKYNRPVGVCGAIASDPLAAPLLIGLGVTELAAGASTIAPLKALVRKLDAKHCAQVAAQACRLSSATEVRALIKKEFAV